jgi:phosphoglycolate phosphatase-like HAD superfamily hydrolase
MVMSNVAAMAAAKDPRPYAVIDIDGVLADVRHRLSYLATRPKDWDGFFAAAPQDPPLAEGLAVARHLAVDHQLVILSGRPERYRSATVTWLREHHLPTESLLLRRDGDRRPSRVTKIEALRNLSLTGDVAILVDDDPAVCAAAESAGFAVFLASWADPQQSLFEAQEVDGAN